MSLYKGTHLIAGSYAGSNASDERLVDMVSTLTDIGIDTNIMVSTLVDAEVDANDALLSVSMMASQVESLQAQLNSIKEQLSAGFESMKALNSSGTSFPVLNGDYKTIQTYFLKNENTYGKGEESVEKYNGTDRAIRKYVDDQIASLSAYIGKDNAGLIDLDNVKAWIQIWDQNKPDFVAAMVKIKYRAPGEAKDVWHSIFKSHVVTYDRNDGSKHSIIEWTSLADNPRTEYRINTFTYDFNSAQQQTAPLTNLQGGQVVVPPNSELQIHFEIQLSQDTIPDNWRAIGIRFNVYPVK